MQLNHLGVADTMLAYCMSVPVIFNLCVSYIIDNVIMSMCVCMSYDIMRVWASFWQRGIQFLGKGMEGAFAYDDPRALQSLRNLASTGADHIALTFSWCGSSRFNDIQMSAQNGATTPFESQRHEIMLCIRCWSRYLNGTNETHWRFGTGAQRHLFLKTYLLFPLFPSENRRLDQDRLGTNRDVEKRNNKHGTMVFVHTGPIRPIEGPAPSGLNFANCSTPTDHELETVIAAVRKPFFVRVYGD